MDKRSSAFLDRLMLTFAPRTTLAGVWKTLGFVGGIIALNQLVEVGLLGTSDFDPLQEAMMIVLLATPLVALVCLATGRQLRLMKQLARLAATDQLTQVANRRAFFDKAASRLSAGSGTLMIADIDHFKSVNDQYGHAVGDMCLKAFAELLTEAVAGNGVVGRLGGEEFAIFLPGEDVSVYTDVSARICDGLFLHDQGRRVTVSGGLVTLKAGFQLIDGLAQADEALYRAKGEGRGRMLRYPDMSTVVESPFVQRQFRDKAG